MPEADLALVMRKSEVSDLKVEYSVPPVVSGPIALGAPLGQVIVHNGDEVMTKIDVVSPVAVGPEPQILNAVTVGADDTNKDTTTISSTQEKK